MKKIIIPSVIVVWVLIAQSCYILKLQNDLRIRKSINEETIMQVLDRKFEYTKNEDKQVYAELNYNELPEPSDCDEDIVKRIEMLEMHLDYNPSKKWIKDVLSSAKNKITNEE